MAVLAVKSAKLTNSRGFCVELSAAMTVILASRFGLPVSTTMIACGAILTIGLREGAQGVNWRLALRIFVGWVSFVVAVFRGKKKTKKTRTALSHHKLEKKTFQQNLFQVLTLVVACGVAAAIASFGVYSPNRAASMAAGKVRAAAAKAAKAAASAAKP